MLFYFSVIYFSSENAKNTKTSSVYCIKNLINLISYKNYNSRYITFFTHYVHLEINNILIHKNTLAYMPFWERYNGIINLNTIYLLLLVLGVLDLEFDPVDAGLPSLVEPFDLAGWGIIVISSLIFNGFSCSVLLVAEALFLSITRLATTLCAE